MSAKPIEPGKTYLVTCKHFTAVICASNGADAIVQGIDQLIQKGVQA